MGLSGGTPAIDNEAVVHKCSFCGQTYSQKDRRKTKSQRPTLHVRDRLMQQAVCSIVGSAPSSLSSLPSLSSLSGCIDLHRRAIAQQHVFVKSRRILVSILARRAEKFAANKRCGRAHAHRLSYMQVERCRAGQTAFSRPSLHVAAGICRAAVACSGQRGRKSVGVL